MYSEASMTKFGISASSRKQFGCQWVKLINNLNYSLKTIHNTIQYIDGLTTVWMANQLNNILGKNNYHSITTILRKQSNCKTIIILLSQCFLGKSHMSRTVLSYSYIATAEKMSKYMYKSVSYI